MLPLKFLVVLASSIGGDRLFLGIVSLCRPPPQDRGRAKAAGNRFARDENVPGPHLGAKQFPEERPRESAETWHTSPQPSRHVRGKGAAPLSGAEEQTTRAFRAYAMCACLLFFANGEYELDWT